jgi:hypothetical protein
VGSALFTHVERLPIIPSPGDSMLPLTEMICTGGHFVAWGSEYAVCNMKMSAKNVKHMCARGFSVSNILT